MFQKFCVLTDQCYITKLVEGVLRQIANPFSEKRMELILKQMLEVAEKEQGQGEMQSDGKDEISISYYGEHCSCSKKAKCKSSKCLCFLRDEKCSPECHNGKNNCTNI